MRRRLADARGDGRRLAAALLAAGGASPWITWQPCPRCGEPAAVDWAPADTRPVSANPPTQRAVEFDCTHGCMLSDTELRALTDRRGE